MELCVLTEKASDLLNRRTRVPAVLVAEKSIQSLDFAEGQHSVAFQVGCHEDFVNVLQLLGLQLVRGVDHELGKVVELHRLRNVVEMHMFLLVWLQNLDGLLLYLRARELRCRLGRDLHLQF